MKPVAAREALAAQEDRNVAWDYHQKAANYHQKAANYNKMDIKSLYAIYKECGGKVTTDTRTLKGGELFFALKGENFDGNEYASKALEDGAGYAVVNSSSAADKTYL